MIFGLTRFFAWAPVAFPRSKLARRCFMLVGQQVELMRDPQIEALPCELVTPVRLLINETRVLHSDPFLTQKNSNAC
jgi:hypothetical protein